MKGPYYLGIGANRSGTGSLHYALLEHPELREYHGKEMHFWDKGINRGKSVAWYLDCLTTPGKKTGEFTPAYYRTPGLPHLFKEHIPNTKFLVLLRNPIESLFSSYRRGMHRRSFPGYLNGHVEAFLRGDGSDEFMSRRRYADHLERWFDIFPREQFWITQSERLWRDPPPVMASLWQFLDVEKLDIPYLWTMKDRAAPPFPWPDIREKLVEYFHPHNEALYNLLGERYDWE